jgi:Domain of unknown function (DUF4198)
LKLVCSRHHAVATRLESIHGSAAYKRVAAMKNSLTFFAFITSLLASMPLLAHEFWFEPVTAPLAAGDTARLDLRVGEFFEGESLGFSMPQTAALRQYSASGNKDLRSLLPPPSRGAIPTLNLPMLASGTQLVSFDSQPSQISLAADRFHAYLHDEGLDFIKTQREATGNAEKPGRERYRRHVKTLLWVGSLEPAATGTDMTYATRTGQRLEIVPPNDPLVMKPGDALGLQVFFDDKPLAGALLKAWNKQGGQTLIIRAKTSVDGKAAFNLPYPGGWMISVVHMVPSSGVKDIDWDSHWGNLSFHLPPAMFTR